MQSHDATTPPTAATFGPLGQGLRNVESSGTVESSGADEERNALPEIEFTRPVTPVELDRRWQGEARATDDEFCVDRLVTAPDGSRLLATDEAAYAAYVEDYDDENDVDELPTPESWAYATGRGEVPA